MEMKETVNLSEVDAQQIFASTDRKISVRIVNAEAFAQKSNGELAFLSCRTNGDYSQIDENAQSDKTYDLRFARDTTHFVAVDAEITALAKKKSMQAVSRVVTIDAAVELNFAAEVFAFVEVQNADEIRNQKETAEYEKLKLVNDETIRILEDRGFSVNTYQNRFVVTFEMLEILNVRNPSIDQLKNQIQKLEMRDAYARVIEEKNTEIKSLNEKIENMRAKIDESRESILKQLFESGDTITIEGEPNTIEVHVVREGADE